MVKQGATSFKHHRLVETKCQLHLLTLLLLVEYLKTSFGSVFNVLA